MKKLIKTLLVVLSVGMTSSVYASLPGCNVSITGIDYLNPTTGNECLNNMFGYVLGRIYTNSDSVIALGNNINLLNNKIDEIEDKTSAGVATSNAFSGLDNHLDTGKKFGIGIGSGYYNSQGSVAFGGIIRTSTNSALNAGTAVATSGDFSIKAGWNMQF